MKPQAMKREYIKLRAEGNSLDKIASALHISKGTAYKWETALEGEVAELKKAELNNLYELYGMKKQARIKNLGETIKRMDEALASVDFEKIAPEKLLELRLKYAEALQKEYAPLKTIKVKNGEEAPSGIIEALADLLERVRAGEASTEQAGKESLIISNLLKAFELMEVRAKLEEMETIIRENEKKQ